MAGRSAQNSDRLRGIEFGHGFEGRTTFVVSTNGKIAANVNQALSAVGRFAAAGQPAAN